MSYKDDEMTNTQGHSKVTQTQIASQNLQASVPCFSATVCLQYYNFFRCRSLQGSLLPFSDKMVLWYIPLGCFFFTVFFCLFFYFFYYCNSSLKTGRKKTDGNSFSVILDNKNHHVCATDAFLFKDG